MKRLIVDLDNTISFTSKGDYLNSKPNIELIDMLHQYKLKGFEIVVFTSRNMRTHKNNIGKINIYTLPNILDWLNNNNVPFDEVIVGKPWCGFDGFYVDDKAIRPSEFISNTYEEIKEILSKEIQL